MSITPPNDHGSDTLHRYWDPKLNITIVKVKPGDVYVTSQQEAIVTVLGSCVSACIRDTNLGVGGLNHFMLPIKNPGNNATQLADNAYGHWAMEYLINQVLESGGRRRMLEVKIFGGGKVINNISSEVCERNITFIMDYLYNENLTIKARDLGGCRPRIIMYFPKTGVVKLKYLPDFERDTVMKEELSYLSLLDKKLKKGTDIELF